MHIRATRHKGRYRGALALTVAITLVAAACGDDADEPAAPDGEVTTTTAGSTTTAAGADTDECAAERAGGTLTMGVWSETVGLDPVVVPGNGKTGGSELVAVYDSLMRWNPEAGEYEPHVAESLEANEDFTEWTLTLRDGVRFGNGDPLTTEAVVANLQRHLDPDQPSRDRSIAELVTETEVLDERTMVFRLDDPWGNFPFLLTKDPGYIANPAVLEELGPEEFNLAPVGAGVGPFEVGRYVPGEELVLEGKDDYWGGPVCLDELRFVAVGGGDAAYEMLIAGEIDVAFITEPLVANRAHEDGRVAISSVLSAGNIILMNSGVRDTEPPTADVRVRRAIAHAIDPVEIDERINEGTGRPTSALLDADAALYPGVDGPGHDPDLARQLVEEVKAEGDWDGSIRLLCDQGRNDMAIAVAAMLGAVGFDVDVGRPVEISELINQVITNANYDLACWAIQIYENIPWQRIALTYQSDAATNVSGFGDPAMDDALRELKQAFTLEDKREALAEVQRVWNETAPSAVFAAVEELIATGDHVHGIYPSHAGIVHFDQAYIER